MKRNVILTLILLLTGVLNAQQSGIKFETQSLQDALNKAGQEGKLVFVDAFTTWCGPCKWMAANVFTDSAVGAYFDKKFVALALDMEKGAGVDFAKHYKVNAYPTFLLLNPDGQVHERFSGAQPAPEFLASIEKCFEPGFQSLENMLQSVLQNPNDVALQQKYILRRDDAGLDPDTVAQMYMPNLEDERIFDKGNVDVFFTIVKTARGKAFNNAFQNWDKLESNPENKEFSRFLAHFMSYQYYKERHEGRPNTADSIYALLKGVNKLEAKKKIMHIDLGNLYQSGDKLGFCKLLDSGIKAGYYSPAEVNDDAYDIATKNDDPEILKYTLKWINWSVKKDANYFNLDSKAYILHKLGDQNGAIAWMQKAIARGKADGMDTAPSEELLAEWQAE